MANNVKNPTKVITGPDTRWSYCNAWEPKAINGGEPKYSVSLIIPKSDKKTIAKIKAAIEAAYREGEAKLKGNGRSVPALSVLKTPLRDGDTERPDDEACEDGGQESREHRAGRNQRDGSERHRGLCKKLVGEDRERNRCFPRSGGTFQKPLPACTSFGIRTRQKGWWQGLCETPYCSR